MLIPNMIFSKVSYVYISCLHEIESKRISKIVGLTSFQQLNWDSKVTLRRGAPNTNEQRSQSGLFERVIRRKATDTEGLV